MTKKRSWKDLTAIEGRATAAALVTNAGPIVEAVTRNSLEAVALSEVNRPASYDRDVIGRFDNTLAAHVFGLVRSQLTHSVVLALARLWDTGSDTRSIPTLTRTLTRR